MASINSFTDLYNSTYTTTGLIGGSTLWYGGSGIVAYGSGGSGLQNQAVEKEPEVNPLLLLLEV